RLEDQGERKAAIEVHGREAQDDRIPRRRQAEKRDDQNVRVVKRLAAEEDEQLAPRVPGDVPVSEPSVEQPSVILREHPIERAETVEERRVQMLVPVKPRSWVMGREAEDASREQGRVRAPNVHERVM